MLITMFTDASFFDKTGAAAWALWAKSQRGVIRSAGLIRRTVIHSSEAELLAIANGLHCVVKSSILERGDAVLIQADNLHALGCIGKQKSIGQFKKPRPSMSPVMREASESIVALAIEHELEIRTRHVKAHSGTGQPRLWVHTDCDRRCRAIARDEHLRRLASNNPIPPSMRSC